MADFDVNTITVQGAVAIASATAGDKLVIDGCDATTDVLTQAQAVQIATRPVSPASTTGTIGLAGSTDNHVYAYASFIRGESTGGDVHSFLLYGHMESDATNVFVVAVASATAPTHIPTSSDVTNRVEIQFELTFSATDEVVTVTDTSMYTTRGEFLILKNRTVTTHAEGQATVGEDQTVYGNKDFKNAVDFNSIYTVQASRTETQGGTDNTNTLIFSPKPSTDMGTHFIAMTRDDGTDYMSSEATMSAGSLMLVSGGAMFDVSHTSNNTQASVVASGGMNQATAGVEVKPTQVTLYTNPAGSSARRTLSYTGGQLTGSFNTINTSNSELSIYVRASLADIDMYFDATTPDATWKVGLTNVNNYKTASLEFYAGADSGGQLTCVSATGGVSKLGTSDTPWHDVYVSNCIHSPLITGDQEELILHAQGIGNGKSEIGMYCTNSSVSVSINLQANQESNVVYAFTRYSLSGIGKDLGSANGQWENVYAKGISLPPLTITPNVTPDTDVPIGCTLLVYLYIGAHAQNVYHAPGTEWTSNGNNMAVGVLTESGFQRMTDYNKIKSGYKFVLLSGAFSAGGSTSLDGTYVPALVRRIA